MVDRAVIGIGRHDTAAGGGGSGGAATARDALDDGARALRVLRPPHRADTRDPSRDGAPAAAAHRLGAHRGGAAPRGERRGGPPGEDDPIDASTLLGVVALAADRRRRRGSPRGSRASSSVPILAQVGGVAGCGLARSPRVGGPARPPGPLPAVAEAPLVRRVDEGRGARASLAAPARRASRTATRPPSKSCADDAPRRRPARRRVRRATGGSSVDGERVAASGLRRPSAARPDVSHDGLISARPLRPPGERRRRCGGRRPAPTALARIDAAMLAARRHQLPARRSSAPTRTLRRGRSDDDRRARAPTRRHPVEGVAPRGSVPEPRVPRAAPQRSSCALAEPTRCRRTTTQPAVRLVTRRAGTPGAARCH